MKATVEENVFSRLLTKWAMLITTPLTINTFGQRALHY